MMNYIGVYFHPQFYRSIPWVNKGENFVVINYELVFADKILRNMVDLI